MVGWPLEKEERCQIGKLYTWYTLVFSQRLNPIKKLAPTYPRQVKWLNKGRVGKCHSYYHFIMKDEGRKSCNVHIMPTQKIVSFAFHTWGFSMNNLRVDSKLLIAINSSISSSFSSLGQYAINLRYSTCFSGRRTWPKLLISFFSLPIQLVLRCSSIHFLRTFAHRVYLGRAMAFS
jgi:hypothetical protein